MATRRSLLTATIAIASPARATEWSPDRPVRLIAPFPPGGVVDLLARSLAGPLAALGQPVIVENRPGAGGNIGAAEAARAAPDGHTLLLSPTGPLASNAALYRSMPFDPERAFAPIALVLDTPMVLATAPAQPWRDLGALLTAARAQPGAFACASAGNGTTPHLGLELLKRMAGIDLVHVPYRGAAAAMTALVGGEVPLIVDTLALITPQLREGRARPLGVTSAARSPAWPEVPTIAEGGVPGYACGSWFGLVAPAATPPAAIARWAAATEAALARPEVAQRFADQGTLGGMGPDAFAAFIRTERAKWTEVVRASGARID